MLKLFHFVLTKFANFFNFVDKTQKCFNVFNKMLKMFHFFNKTLNLFHFFCKMRKMIYFFDKMRKKFHFFWKKNAKNFLFSFWQDARNWCNFVISCKFLMFSLTSVQKSFLNCIANLTIWLVVWLFSTILCVLPWITHVLSQLKDAWKKDNNFRRWKKWQATKIQKKFNQRSLNSSEGSL